jgi:hypothetical protein
MKKTLRLSLALIAFVLPLLSNMAASAQQKEIRAENPAAASCRRFVDNGDGTVTDTNRNLMWQKGDNGEEVTFEQARAYCRNLRLGGRSDWRLPKPGELDTPVDVQLMAPLHSPEAYARFDLYWSGDPTVLLPFNYHPSRGAEVSRAYFAGPGDRAFVRAVRSLTVSPPGEGG